MKFVVVFFSFKLPVNLFMALSCLSLLLSISMVHFLFHLLYFSLEVWDFKLYELSMKGLSMS